MTHYSVKIEPSRFDGKAAEEQILRVMSTVRALSRDNDADREHWLSVVEENRIHYGMRCIPARYADAMASEPAVAQWVDAVIAGCGDGLLLVGPVGTGKTWQAYGALRELIAAGVHDFIASTAADLLDECRPGGDGNALQKAKTARVLFIDDIGAFKASEWTAETLYRLIDARWSAMLPTIITTNLAPKDLGESLGDRLSSRLAGCCRQVALKGNDRRRVSA